MLTEIISILQEIKSDRD